MARKTDAAVSDFEFASGQAANASGRQTFVDGVPSSVEEVNARCMSLGVAAGSTADGLEKLAGALKDIFDKLEAIDRKIS